MTAQPAIPHGSPFALDDDGPYRRWRDAKLHDYPVAANALVVEVADPRRLTDAEHRALLARLRKTNMALYASPGAGDDKAIPLKLGARFGLTRLDRNYLAEEDGLSAITVSSGDERRLYIPYTDRPLKWHTDGYYNTGANAIGAFILHCVRDAAEGGENRLLDHDVAYLLLRDENPDYVRALMAPDAMTIPPGTDGTGGYRGPSVGPVFSVRPGSGALHMRYTARKRNIQWKQDRLTLEAVAFLGGLLESPLPYIFHARLEPGMGLICNNVLHDRAAFRDLPGHPKRLLYRARFLDRVDTVVPQG